MSRLTEDVKSSHNHKLQNEVQKFVEAVSREADLAFSDVHEILGEIAFLKPSELNEDKVREFQQRLILTYSKDKFKNVHKRRFLNHSSSDFSFAWILAQQQVLAIVVPG